MAKYIVDSSILIEYLKGNDEAKEIIELLRARGAIPFLNAVVFSEVTFIFLKYMSGKDYRAIKGNTSLLKSLGPHVRRLHDFMRASFRELSIASPITDTSLDFIQKYALLPNDALILSTCKFYEIDSLLSFDSDFTVPCKAEDVRLVNSVKSLKETF